MHSQCGWCTGEKALLSLPSCELVRSNKLFWNQERRGTKSIHTCWKCGISQRFCVTGEDETKQCQWPGIMVPVLATVAICSAKSGGTLLQMLGVEISPHLDSTMIASYATNWFTQKHCRLKWGAVVSNGMAVLGAVLTQPALQAEIRRCLADDLTDL
jgi:hypothetical protein